MAIVGIRLNPKTSKKVDEAIRELLKRVEDLRPLNASLAKYMVSDIRRRITYTKISPDGVPWAPLSETTENLRARISDISGPHQEMLMFLRSDIGVDTGELRQSIEVSKVGRSEFEIKADSPHASFMQFGVSSTGGYIKGARVPARPFMGFSDANKKTILRKLREYLDTGKP